MPYPGQFHRLVMIGSIYTDTWNMTLSIVPSALGELGMPAVDTATLTGVAADVSAWFTKTTAAGGPGFYNATKLTSIKLNRIGTDGRYVDNLAQEHIYPSPITPSASANPLPQQALAVSLLTALERGRGSRGRIYLLPNGHMGSFGTDGRLTTTQATAAATGVKDLVTALNTRYSLIGRVGVASEAGVGRFEHVTRIGCGRVADTIRSRRSTQPEDHQIITV